MFYIYIYIYYCNCVLTEKDVLTWNAQPISILDMVLHTHIYKFITYNIVLREKDLLTWNAQPLAFYTCEMYTDCKF